MAVALALDDYGHRALGLRLDSGDLAYLSKAARAMLHRAADAHGRAWLAEVNIVASNDINEHVSRQRALLYFQHQPLLTTASKRYLVTVCAWNRLLCSSEEWHGV
jgi:hypothetical protein